MTTVFAAFAAARRLLAIVWHVVVIVHDTLAGVTVAAIILLLLCFGGAHAGEMAPKPVPAPHHAVAPLPPMDPRVQFSRCNGLPDEIGCLIAVAHRASR